MTQSARDAVTDGFTIVDKPSGITSHDVVARMRRLAHTRRVGHAGTLDPMATGVLVVAIGNATRLLSHLDLDAKSYSARIRLGQSTSTDDAEGEPSVPVSAAEVTEADVITAVARLTGQIMQVPSSVSAIKIDGERAYKRVRAGEQVELAPRPVTVSRFDVTDLDWTSGFLDLTAQVDCSAGTYIRALARDLGSDLGVGGHLTRLRRTRVGPFTVEQAMTLDQLASEVDPVTIPLVAAVRAAMPVHEVSPEELIELSFGRSVMAAGYDGTYAAVAPDDTVVALLRDVSDRARPILVFAAR